jgi:hypothetical protein
MAFSLAEFEACTFIWLKTSEAMIQLNRRFWSVLLSAVMLCNAGWAPAAERDVPHSQYVVPLEGCPSKITLTIPREFVHASTPEARERRESIIARVHQNPYRKARYTEVFMADWDSPSGLPHIALASLGSLLKLQGRISPSEWNSIKREFLNLSEARREQLFREYAERVKKGGSPELNTLRTQLSGLFEETDNSLVILSTSTATIDSVEARFLSAAKMFYIRRCVAYIALSVLNRTAQKLRFWLPRFARRR